MHPVHNLWPGVIPNYDLSHSIIWPSIFNTLLIFSICNTYHHHHPWRLHYRQYSPHYFGIPFHYYLSELHLRQLKTYRGLLDHFGHFCRYSVFKVPNRILKTNMKLGQIQLNTSCFIYFQQSWTNILIIIHIPA